jgi:hypothetical protein
MDSGTALRLAQAASTKTMTSSAPRLTLNATRTLQ